MRDLATTTADAPLLELRGLLRRAEPRPWGITLDGRDLSGEYLLVDSVIYSFHMPLFFFLSGYFINTAVPFFDFFKK